jgi:hypothetical protein
MKRKSVTLRPTDQAINARIGTEGWIKPGSHGMFFPVLIVDTQVGYGHAKFKVKPSLGLGYGYIYVDRVLTEAQVREMIREPDNTTQAKEIEHDHNGY